MKGIENLISNKLVENTPASVAQFLRNTPNLDKVGLLSKANFARFSGSGLILSIVAGNDW